MFIAIPATLLYVCVFIFSFYRPDLGAWIFIGIFILGVEGYALVSLYGASRGKIADDVLSGFTPDEIELLTAYKLHFRYPFFTKELSSIIAGAGLISIAFAILLIWKERYIEAGVIALNYPVAGPISHKLSPLNGLTMMANKGNLDAVRRLNAWESTWNKLLRM